jgi:hypothetical protein
MLPACIRSHGTNPPSSMPSVSIASPGPVLRAMLADRWASRH